MPTSPAAASRLPGMSSVAPGITRLVLDQGDGPGQGDGGEGDVDVQAPAPGQVLGQHAAEDQPDRPAAPAIAVKMPSALPRSRGSVKVVVSRASAEGASSAPNAPCTARAATRAPKSGAAPPYRRCDGEADQADDEGPLAAEQVRKPAADEQQAAERQRVRGEHPLPVGGAEAQRPLGRWKRDVHDGGVEHHHQLGHADHGQAQPAASGRFRSGGLPGRHRRGRAAVWPLGTNFLVHDEPPS